MALSKPSPAIWFVHGAGASPHSFNWLRDHLPEHDPHFFTYQVDESVEGCIHRLNTLISHAKTPVVLIGHSLGGIIARACARRDTVARLVTLCAPFGGMPQADFLALFRWTPMFHEIGRFSPLLWQVRTTAISAPHLAIVGTHGLPFTSEPNDGVGTVASQMAIPGQDYVCVALNHFEVLLSADVATAISIFLADS